MNCPNCPDCGKDNGLRIQTAFGSPRRFAIACGCGWMADIESGILIAAAMAHHMRPLDEPHAYRDNPDYPGQCDEPVGSPATACDRAPECHTVLLPRSCPHCGAGILIGQKIAVCEANKYSSSLGAGDCRWSLTLTPDLRRQADEALAAQVAA